MDKAALKALETYFEHRPSSFPDTRARQTFCALIMEKGRLFYEEVYGAYMKVKISHLLFKVLAYLPVRCALRILTLGLV